MKKDENKDHHPLDDARWAQAAALEMFADGIVKLCELVSTHVDGLDFDTRHDLYRPLACVETGAAQLAAKVQALFDELHPERHQAGPAQVSTSGHLSRAGQVCPPAQLKGGLCEHGHVICRVCHIEPLEQAGER